MARGQKRKSSKEDIGAIVTDSYIKDITTGINKEFGKVSYILNEGDSPTEIKGFISTGSTLLDVIISNSKEGGAPLGRIVEICGTESSGKSLIAIHMIKDTIKKGGVPIYIDTENATSIDFMKRVGVDVDKLIYVQAKTVEEVFDIAENVIRNVREKNDQQIITLIWDSVAATPTKEELNQTYDHKEMASAAKVISRGLKKLTQYLGHTNVAFVALNQLKQNINTFGFGDKWFSPGGMAFKYHASVRVMLSKGSKIKSKDGTIIGVGAYAEVKKNKISMPFRKCEFNVYFQYGIDDISSWTAPLEGVGAIYGSNKDGELAKKAAQYYSIVDVDEESGEEIILDTIKKAEFRNYIINNPQLQEKFRAKVIDSLIINYDEDTELDVSEITVELDGEEADIASMNDD